MRALLFCSAVVALMLSLAWTGQAVAQADKPLGEQELTALLGLGIDEAAIVARIQKGGLAFEPTAAALDKLKAAGATETLVKAIQAAGQKPAAPAAAPADAITYEQVLQLVKLGIDEPAIIARLEKSLTRFVLDANQVDALKKAGASDKLLAAMAKTGAAAGAVAARDISDLAIILDCSGSMREATKEGESKMAAAKRVVADLVNKIPNGLNVTLVIYGHEVFGGAEDPRNCQAVKVARPLAPLDDAGKSELSALIGRLQPTGATPIALSLRVTGEELAKSGALCGIVLVTDGIESCKGDPAAEAAALAAKLKLTFGVNVVSFGLRPEEDAAVEKIATAGKGKFYGADNAKELADSLGAIAKEIEQNAKKADTVTTNRRALQIVKPDVDLLPLKEIILTEAGTPKNTLENYVKARTSKFGEEIRIPNAEAKYELWWVPQSGHVIKMVTDLSFPERKIVELKPEKYLGLIRVNGTGAVKQILVVPAGTPKTTRNSYTTQETKKYGEWMVVPAGKYDVWIDDNVIEEGFEVAAGKGHELE